MAEEKDNTGIPAQSEPEPEQPHTPLSSETLVEDSAAADPERIGFGKRLGAYLLDSIFTLIAAGVVAYALKDLLAGLVPADPNVPTEMAEMISALAAAGGICGLLYWLIEGFTGASPGKMILAIKIGTENHTPAETGTLLTRYAIKTSSSIFTVLGMLLGLQILNTLGTVAGIVITIGCFFALGEAKQALHDKIAHTAVYPEDTLA